MRAHYSPSENRRVWIFVGIMALGVVFFFVENPPVWNVDDLFTVLLFGILIMGAETLAIPLPHGEGFVSVGFAICYAAVIVLGPSIGAILVMLATLNKHDLMKAPWPVLVFNRLELGLSAGIAGMIYHGLAPGVTGILNQGVAFVSGALAYTSINLGLILLFLWIRDKKFPFGYWEANMTWALINYVGLLPMTVLTVYSFREAGWFGVLLLVLPLLVARHSFLLYIEVRQSYLDTITSLVSTIEAKDPYTAGHAQRVSTLCVAIGRQLKLSESVLEKLRFAALLHDIGKIGIRDCILNKPGKYTDEEYEEMKRHSTIGAQILRGVKFLGSAADWVHSHHERWDGSGYPDGLKGDEIPLGARIIGVADSFDAMISKRAYQTAMELQEAWDELNQLSGKLYDPKVIQAFNRVMRNPEIMASFIDDAVPQRVVGDFLESGAATGEKRL